MIIDELKEAATHGQNWKEDIVTCLDRRAIEVSNSSIKNGCTQTGALANALTSQINRECPVGGWSVYIEAEEILILQHPEAGRGEYVIPIGSEAERAQIRYIYDYFHHVLSDEPLVIQQGTYQRTFVLSKDDSSPVLNETCRVQCKETKKPLRTKRRITNPLEIQKILKNHTKGRW